jgi:DNA-binding XRE family transcriptional regulator
MSCKKWGLLEAPAKLLTWRTRSGLDQQGAANEIGIDTATYNAFEKGRKRPGIDIATKIQRVTRGRVLATHWADPRKTDALSRVQ